MKKVNYIKFFPNYLHDLGSSFITLNIIFALATLIFMISCKKVDNNRLHDMSNIGSNQVIDSVTVIIYAPHYLSPIMLLNGSQYELFCLNGGVNGGSDCFVYTYQSTWCDPNAVHIRAPKGIPVKVNFMSQNINSSAYGVFDSYTYTFTEDCTITSIN